MTSHSQPAAALHHALHHAEHILPGQRPLEAFVHHNTLHAFEHLPFEEAVIEAGTIYGAAAYQSEAAFRQAHAAGRIHDVDLDDVLQRRLPDEALPFGDRGLTLREAARRLMLGMPPRNRGGRIVWWVHETDTLRAYPSDLPRGALQRLSDIGPPAQVLPALWAAAQAYPAPQSAATTPAARPRDHVLAVTGDDPDDHVHPVLIRWMAAYLDTDFAQWPMGARTAGLWSSALAHFARAGVEPRRFLRAAARTAKAALRDGTTAEAFVLETFARWGLSATQIEGAVLASLLALRGYAGLTIQLTARPDLAPSTPPPAALIDVLATRLLLDDAAARAILRGAGIDEMPPASAWAPQTAATDPDEGAWLTFQLALRLGVPGPALRAMGAETRATFFGLLDRLGCLPRQALWQLAYERRYRMQVFDSVLAHQAHLEPTPAPKWQLVTCIDDREESLRRHAEELDPHVETFGYAGHYNVLIAFEGLGEAHAAPLCPMGHVPRYRVYERPAGDQGAHLVAQQRRKRPLARMVNTGVMGGRSAVAGSLISTVAGWAAALPMLTHLLAPSWHAKRFTPKAASVATELVIERPPEGTPHGGHGDTVDGYTFDEMATIIQTTLREMGLVRFAPLVLVLGHGSRSLNNPHEAAHDCGACGGGRGGPNGRAFALMANHPEVRARLAADGLVIPEGVHFIGGYHNTADDAVDLYDLDRVPEALRAQADAVIAVLEKARRLDAHERARRFESAPVDLTPDKALSHVEARAQDLAQPRPEYGHCTNTLHFLGRRAWSRGLFLDRRVFLTSYDPGTDPDGALLAALLASVGPVGAGISLEYYFSFVDPQRYGSGTKLPHNITSLIGVMDGHQSDLRTGLPWQMVEIHEPMRLLNLIEAKPDELVALLDQLPEVKKLVLNEWILVGAFDPETNEIWFFQGGAFERHVPETTELPVVARSGDWYTGRRDHLQPASVCSAAAQTAGEAA